MARQFIYHMQGLSKTYPGNRKILEDINLSFYPDAKIGVLGVNGSGKSTLLRIMAGIDKEYNGEAWAAEGARVGYLEQEPQLDAGKSVRENVMQGVGPQKAILDRYNELAVNYSDETADEMTRLQDEIEAKGLWDLDSKIDQAMEALRCPPDDADVGKLSGGERRRVALCRLLLEQPELLLLDEPTNHLDAESVSWLEGHLRSYPGAILIVTHDRYFLDNVTSWILELDRGKGIPYEGNYSSWLQQKQKRLEQEGREEAAHQRTLVREQEWIAASPKARQAKSKARYQRYEDLLKQASEKQTQTAQITIPAVSATACIWRKCSNPAPTCCCWTSRPTISTSIPCGRLKRRWRISPAAPSSSATTAGFSTASPHICWPSRATATSNGSRAISR